MPVVKQRLRASLCTVRRARRPSDARVEHGFRPQRRRSKKIALLTGTSVWHAMCNGMWRSIATAPPRESASRGIDSWNSHHATRSIVVRITAIRKLWAMRKRCGTAAGRTATPPRRSASGLRRVGMSAVAPAARWETTKMRGPGRKPDVVVNGSFSNRPATRFQRLLIATRLCVDRDKVSGRRFSPVAAPGEALPCISSAPWCAERAHNRAPAPATTLRKVGRYARKSVSLRSGRKGGRSTGSRNLLYSARRSGRP